MTCVRSSPAIDSRKGSIWALFFSAGRCWPRTTTSARARPDRRPARSGAVCAGPGRLQSGRPVGYRALWPAPSWLRPSWPAPWPPAVFLAGVLARRRPLGRRRRVAGQGLGGCALRRRPSSSSAGVALDAESWPRSSWPRSWPEPWSRYFAAALVAVGSRRALAAVDFAAPWPAPWPRDLGHLLGAAGDRLELRAGTERRHGRLLDLDAGAGGGVARGAGGPVALFEDAEAGDGHPLTLRHIGVDGLDDTVDRGRRSLLVTGQPGRRRPR